MVLNILVILTNAAYLANCNQNKIAGVTVDYLHNVTNEAFSLGSSCNSDCRCDTSRYEPVCMDGVEYFSACHAGCAASMNFKTKAYGNCSCASSLDTTSFTSNGSISVHPEAIRGKCKSKCYLLYVFVTFQALGVFLTFMKAVPSITIVLRCVNDNQRSFALSLLQLTARACGTIPGPLLFGAILDNACLVWQEKCETKGSCWIYDAEKMSRNFFLLIISCGIANLTLTIISYNLYTPPREDNSDDDYS